jgi:hypothetical protein
MPYRITHSDEEPNYRYMLQVHTDAQLENELNVIQCNPSMASSNRSDPTVGKVSLWAEGQGYGTVRFLNLFARRSPTVAAISSLSFTELVGNRNNDVLRNNCTPNSMLICAWGSTLPVPKQLYHQRILELQAILKGVQLNRVGAMVAGRYPRHGRMWNAGYRDLLPLSWEVLLGQHT